jgi:hypothetical protein
VLVTLTEPGCRVRLIDLAGRGLGEVGPRTACGLWPAPTGGLAAITMDWQDGQDAPWARLALVRLSHPVEVVRVLGPVEGEATWSPDGARVAWCTPSGDTVVHTVATGAEQDVDGCSPRFTARGALLTTPIQAYAGRLLRDGVVELEPPQLQLGFDQARAGGVGVLGYDEGPDGLLAIAVVRLERRGPNAVIELWQDGSFLGAINLPPGSGDGPYPFGEHVRFGGSGTVLAIGTTAPEALTTFVDLRLRRPWLQLDSVRAYAWSPDGAWLAVAEGDGIAFYSTNTPEPVYRVPVRAAALGWSPPPDDG